MDADSQGYQIFEGDAEAWNRLVAGGDDASLLQTWEYGEAKARLGPWRVERGVWGVEAGECEESLMFVLTDISTGFRSDERCVCQILIRFPKIRRNSRPGWLAVRWSVSSGRERYSAVVNLIRRDVLHPFYVCVIITSRLV